MANLRPHITHHGQRYVDDPVHREVSKARPLAFGIAAMFGRRMPQQITEISHYERMRLRWLKPDGNGDLIPRGK